MTGSLACQARVFQPGEEMGHEFDPLGFSAAQGGADLAQFQVTQPGIVQGFQGPQDLLKSGEEPSGFVHGEIKHLADVLPVELDIERFPIKPGALAGFAAHEGRRQEIHLQLDAASSFALRTAALGAVEREPAAGVAPHPGLGGLGEDLADFVKETDVSRRDAARRPANGRLVHFIHRLEDFGSGQAHGSPRGRL